MKIRLEIPKARQLPSQGRNADSNSAGSATASAEPSIHEILTGFKDCPLHAGCVYRAWADPDKSDSEFVFFVGWTRSNDKLIFEDGNGDIYGYTPDEIDIS